MRIDFFITSWYHNLNDIPIGPKKPGMAEKMAPRRYGVFSAKENLYIRQKDLEKRKRGRSVCTSIVHNGRKTVIGWNLDILDMEYRVSPCSQGVYIEINDKTEGWLPLFGANARGDFVAMPTCWPYDQRSDPDGADSQNILMLDIDLLLQKKTFEQIKDFAERFDICSVPGVTFQAQLTDRGGNVLSLIHI